MLSCELVELEPQPAAVVRATVPFDGLPEFFGQAFTAVMEHLGGQGVSPVGPPFGFYPAKPRDVVEVRAGFPVATPVVTGGEVESMVLPGGRAVTTTHVGSYDTLEQTYAELQAWMSENDVVPGQAVWESYVSDPTTAPPEEWCTEIVWPVER
ncbi:MAG: GyrI-like domain-containing protein [Acidimicrobiia bacterium]|nr:GyrI-like domain-containing protein [Acidimicrobiia bacterium]